MDGIFHYFNESFVIDPLNDFERHFAWLSKTSLLIKFREDGDPWRTVKEYASGPCVYVVLLNK